MSIFIGYETALRWWFSYEPSKHCVRSDVTFPSGGRVSTRHISMARELMDLRGGDRLCVLAPSSEERRIRLGCRSAAWSPPNGVRSFCCVGDRIYVSSPQATFLQVATLVPLVELVEVGYRLCASFTIENGEIVERMPITNVARLRAYVDKCKGLRGYKKANEALNYIADRAASPMEIWISMLLSLPHKCGGCGLPAPSLNFEISIPEKYRDAAEKSCYRIDFYWPHASIGVEYDSDSNHAGVDSLHADSKKRSYLEALGIHVLSLTKAQVVDLDCMNHFIAAIKRSMKVRQSCSMEGFRERQHKLRAQLLWNDPPRKLAD